MIVLDSILLIHIDEYRKNEAIGVKMKKLLYVDVPFAQIAGGDTNRSSFIWASLNKIYAADLLLIKTLSYRSKAVPEHSGYNNLYTIASQESLIYAPRALHHFHKTQIRKYQDILRKGQYEIIVFRFLSTFSLADISAETLPDAKIVIDVDMLFSRIAQLSWDSKKSFRNRYHYIELQKLRSFEAKAFSRDFSFFFTNPVERDLAVTEYKLRPENAMIFPNMMPDLCEAPDAPETKQRYILFFGTLNSMANADALDYLMQDIYPAIKTALREENISLRVVGKNPLPRFDKYADSCVRIIGPVDDIRAEIAGAMFVLLPIRVASGTRTRILEAAEIGKAVISTGIGAEGFEFNLDEIVIADDAVAFSNAILRLIRDQELCASLGRNLKATSLAKYSQKVVASNFLKDVEKGRTKQTKNRLKIAIITNRFYPEVGGAETNIYYQARLLASAHDITVICPKRIESKRLEQRDGFCILRLPDILNHKRVYPNLATKTFCPGLIGHLLWNRYDIIQCFPALNYNNILAFWLAKLRKTPYILCFFDFIDYAGYIKEHGKIDPDILARVKPRFYQIPVLKGMDYAFAIANKEIAFLKQFNPKVDYSPVPILSEEYEREVPKPKLMKEWPKDTFVFLSLGRVSYIKGQDIALKAFAEAGKSMPDAKLVFVGRADYEPEFYAEMQSFIEREQLQDKVHFTGMVEREEVLGWLRHSDIHVIPVRFMNSGAVVVESWISDTPVLQSDVVDPNLVQDGVNGYLFARESISECAAKMIRAYQERDKLAGFAARGKELVQSKYTYEYLISLYNSVYEQVRN